MMVSMIKCDKGDDNDDDLYDKDDTGKNKSDEKGDDKDSNVDQGDDKCDKDDDNDGDYLEQINTGNDKSEEKGRDKDGKFDKRNKGDKDEGKRLKKEGAMGENGEKKRVRSVMRRE